MEDGPTVVPDETPVFDAARPQRIVEELDATVLKSLKGIYEAHAQSQEKWSAEQTQVFSEKVQQEEPGSSGASQLTNDNGGLDFKQFLSYMTSQDGAVNNRPPKQDLTWPLASYFISSSHNTYLTGNQLSSHSTTDAYKNVLLRGCRCVEIDVWDGAESDDESETAHKSTTLLRQSQKEQLGRRLSKLKKNLPDSITSKLANSSIEKKLKAHLYDKQQGSSPSSKTESSADEEPPRLKHRASSAEPRVLHGYTLTKEVSFRDVCSAIRDDAFTVSDLPLIISLEVHCRPEQQLLMVSIMKEAFSGFLAPELDVDAAELPSPESLKRKILIKVKYARPEALAEAEQSEDPGDSGDERLPVAGEGDAVPAKPKKAAKIIEELSRLGVYTKAISFKTWTQPEAKMPTHIFSLAEKKYLDHRENHGESLFEHNRNYLLRAYPSGLRIGSSNLNPPPFWASGAQIVALNWQQTDEGIMLNEAMFGDTDGYVLKPSSYRPLKAGVTATPIQAKTLSLCITMIAAQGIPLPKGDKSDKGFNPYIKVEVHVDGNPGHMASKGGKMAVDFHDREVEHKLRTHTHKGRNIDLKEQKLTFPAISGVVEELTFVRFTIRDDEIGHDDLAAWACLRLDRLRSGYRFVHLWDSRSMRSQGAVLIKVEKSLA
ncbi:hypothetical protein VHEMI02049 [[Torrubiella] hemipterigena]|uniref:Phosphoinositide phospholipase C n=1 Tax=[Torrubiella] hemipterigena TaxID=1531966 RepID=A0A0A1T6N5_9HYPO|nr:hypothetical protein VHEMI02049 [[Torrubiella] hemipterigena]